MEPIKTYLLPNETVLLENNANSIVNQGVAKGGKLVLTDKRIFFVAHKFNQCHLVNQFQIKIQWFSFRESHCFFSSKT